MGRCQSNVQGGGRKRWKRSLTQALNGQRLLPWLVCACTISAQDAPPMASSSALSRVLSSDFSVHPTKKHRHRYPDTTPSGLSHFHRYSKHERDLRAKTTWPCRGRRTLPSTRRLQGDRRALCHIPPSTISTVQGRLHSTSSQLHRRNRYAIPVGRLHSHLAPSYRHRTGLTEQAAELRPSTATRPPRDPFRDSNGVQWWECPRCNVQWLADAERVRNLRRHGRYFFECEEPRCGEMLVARQRKPDEPGKPSGSLFFF